jgi:hypothetical protein
MGHARAIVATALTLALILAFAAVASAAPSLSIDSGPSGPTNNTMPLFGFTAEAGATVECSIDQGTPSYGLCSGATTHAPGSPLPEGAYVFRVRATDVDLAQTEETRTFSVDTAPPSLAIASGPAGPTNDATPSFGFAAEPGATVECSVDDGTPAYGPCSSATSHDVVNPLPEGSHTFRVRATDAAGNQAEASQTFDVDTAPPAVSVVSGPAGPTNDATPSFGFTVDAGATFECSVDQGTLAYGPCSSATSHDVANPLPDGFYHFRVRGIDAAGNQASALRDFSVDRAAPSLSIVSGPAGPTNDATPAFGFTTDFGATVACSVDQGGYGPCTGATTHAIGSTLPEGPHVFRVRATNGIGNQAIASHTFTVDVTPPTLSIGFGPSGTISDNTPLFGFRAESGATVQCSIDQGAPVYGSCASATTHAADAPLTDGAYVFRVQATDAAGNQATATRAFAVDAFPQTPGSESPRPDPTPPVTRPSAPRLLSPFPLVRISGTLTSRGARIRLLSVRAPRGALVRVTVRPACSSRRPSSRRCRVLQAAGTVGRRAVISFRSLERKYPSGTVIVVRVWRGDRIGKYTRFTIVRGKAPRRVDQCLVPEATRGSRCPSA